MEDRAREILRRVIEADGVPSLSAVALRLVELASDEDVSVAQLAEVIEKDPGLATRLLKLVNSPGMRLGEKEITSIERAVVIMGLRELRLMALGLSLRDTLPLKEGGQDYYFYWRGSLYRAVMTSRMARALGLDNTEELFVAGLVLELGLPLMLKAARDEWLEGFVGVAARLEDQVGWEREHLGLDHREVGKKALEAWGLPEVLVASQKLLLDDGEVERSPQWLKLVEFCRRATEAFFLDGAGMGRLHELGQKWLGIEPGRLNELMTEAMGYVQDAAQALEVELDHQRDLITVMEKANQALLRLSMQAREQVREVVGVGEQRRVKEEVVVNTLEAVAHEIRNPLMSLGGFARRLAKMLGEDEKVKRYLDVMLSEAGRLNQVLEEMNALVRPYSPGTDPVDLREVLQEVARIDRDEVPQVKLKLPSESLVVRADREGLKRAFKRLIVYGGYLMGLGGEQGPVNVLARVSGARASVVVFGPGVSPGSEGDPLAGRSFGPELGVALARRIVEAHGGELVVKAGRGGQGFILEALLPLA